MTTAMNRNVHDEMKSFLMELKRLTSFGVMAGCAEEQPEWDFQVE